jgi:hypothetical protein
MRLSLALAVPAAASLLLACQTYQDDLARSQRAFEQNDHERALAILRQLEPDTTAHLSPSEQAQYAYLRGMTDYRIGYRVDARHWLAVAKALDDSTPGLLPTDWKGRMGEALTDLNENVYGGGIESLSNAKRAAGDEDATEKKRKPKKSEDEP